ncbi:MAG: ATP-dependent protease ATPase subunit HslU [Candidatus Marinimicrobia bacterium]|nr:ATP-dependent protease ATPase subunit HslU [Candidatus Neomarinimicrobiota bacterium]
MMQELTPRQIVRELNKYIVGQSKAKRAVAIALRNRWRRQQVPEGMRDEILPNNIILIGPTGVGKTEIARRLANLANAPFIKIEASKFTEVGYVGRDVESIIRDLTDTAVNMVRMEKQKAVAGRAAKRAQERLIDLLLPDENRKNRKRTLEEEERSNRTRATMMKKLENGDLEDKDVHLEVKQDSMPIGMQVFGPMGMEDIGSNIKDMLSNVMPGNKKQRRMKVKDARGYLIESEAQKLIDQDELVRVAKDNVENNGIVFLDEIDKVVGDGNSSGPDVSREGVQRDLLPIVEGSTVPTKYGSVKSDHILFIAAGAFHVATPSDMIPELQGRFPIRVEMDKLSTSDFIKILTHPKSALIKQYTALLAAEKMELEFDKTAIKAIAEIATEVNNKTENIGARRLHTIMTTVLDNYMFEHATKKEQKITITKAIVEERLEGIVKDEDLSRYIL